MILQCSRTPSACSGGFLHIVSSYEGAFKIEGWWGRMRPDLLSIQEINNFRRIVRYMPSRKKKMGTLCLLLHDRSSGAHV